MSVKIILASINAKWIHPSLALRLLKANLGGLESCCRILEFALRQNPDEIIDSILDARPQILGLSVSIWNHKATVELLKNLNEKWLSADPAGTARPFVILGGPEVSWLPPDSGIFTYADYVIRGEGEEAFRGLCERLLDSGAGDLPPENKLPRKTEFINAAPPDVSRLVSAYGLYTDEDLSRRLIYVESARGCPYGCDFCLSAAEQIDGSAYSGKSKIREFPVENFLAEMGRLLDRIDSRTEHTHTFKFLDRSFNVNPGRAVRILEFFLERILKSESRICVHFEMVPFNFPMELREIIKQFPPGSLRLELGIQTLNSTAAANINRPGNTDTALEILAFLRSQTSVVVHADLIAGLPGEDLESFGRGFDRLWIAMTSGQQSGIPMEIQAGMLKLLPGAPMKRHSVPYGMEYSAEPPYEVLQTLAVPAAQMDRIRNFARFWELLVNRGHFANQITSLVPHGEPVFLRFMELSDRLLQIFGRSWGIDREEIRCALEEYVPEQIKQIKS
ncbi:MAG: DUF4080 domain-containing protein [Treponema sp.]|nr:DUF4080 domain-containing protein [Treponema sp.]